MTAQNNWVTASRLGLPTNSSIANKGNVSPSKMRETTYSDGLTPRRIFPAPHSLAFFNLLTQHRFRPLNEAAQRAVSDGTLSV